MDKIMIGYKYGVQTVICIYKHIHSKIGVKNVL